MTIGVRRASWMMAGELSGVALTAVSAVIGVAAVMLRYPELFTLLKWAGGAYLVYLGVTMWRARESSAIASASSSDTTLSRRQLITQGFVTAVANPKGWAFDIALLPPFINADAALAPQLTLLVAIILALELACLLIYAGGGRVVTGFLRNPNNVVWLNRIAGSLMIGVGVWLALE
jgi:threonine/homoserine/homoserine lactone efflux protein